MGYKELNVCSSDPVSTGTSKLSPELIFPCAVPSATITDLLQGKIDLGNTCGPSEDRGMSLIQQLHKDMQGVANYWIEEADNLSCSPCASSSYAMVGYYTEAAKGYLQNLMHAFLPIATGEEYNESASPADISRIRSNIDHTLEDKPAVCNVPLKQMADQARWYLDAAEKLLEMGSSVQDWMGSTFFGPGTLTTIDEAQLDDYCNRTGPYIKSNFQTARAQIEALKAKYRPTGRASSSRGGITDTRAGRVIGDLFNGFTRGASRLLTTKEQVISGSNKMREDIAVFLRPHQKRKDQGRWQWLQYLGYLNHRDLVLEGKKQADILLNSGSGSFQDFITQESKLHKELEEVLVQLYLTEQVRKEYNDQCDANKRLFYSQQLDPDRQTRTKVIQEGDGELPMTTTDLKAYAQRFDELVAHASLAVPYPMIYQSDAGKQLFTELYHLMLLHTKGSEAADKLSGHDPVGLAVTMAKGLYNELLKDALSRKHGHTNGTTKGIQFISIPSRGVHQLIRSVERLEPNGAVETKDGQTVPVYVKWQQHLGRDFVFTDLPRDPNHRYDELAPQMLFVRSEEDIDNPVLRQHNGTYHSLSNFWEEYHRDYDGTITPFIRGAKQPSWNLEQHHTWWTPNNLLANSFFSASGHLMSSVVNKNYDAYYNWQSLHRSLSEEESYALDRFRVFATKMRSLKELELGEELTPLTGVSRKIADNLLKWRSASCATDDVADHRDNLPADHPDSPSQPSTTPEDQCRALLHADPATQSIVFEGYRSYLVLQAIAQSCSRYVVSGDEWTQMSEAKRNETLQELRKCKEASRKQAERRFDALFAEKDRFGVPANLLEEICQFSVNYQLSEHKALQSAASVTNPDERYYYSRQAIIASLTHEIPVSLGSQAGYWGAFALARSKLLPEAVRLFTQPAAIIAGIGLTAGDGYELGVNALDLESSLAKGDAASYQTLTLINRSVGLVIDVLGEATQTLVSIGKCKKGDNEEDIADADWHDLSRRWKEKALDLEQEALAIESQEAGITEDTPPNVWTIINKEQQTAIIVVDGNRRFNRETKIMIAKQLKKAREQGYSPHIEMSQAAAQANPDVPVVLVTTLDDTDEGQTDQETNKEENTLAGSIARALYAPIDHLVNAAEEVTDAAAQASTPQAEADPVQPAQPRPSVANLLLGVPDRIAKCLSLSLRDDGGIPPKELDRYSSYVDNELLAPDNEHNDYWFRYVHMKQKDDVEQLGRFLVKGYNNHPTDLDGADFNTKAEAFRLIATRAAVALQGMQRKRLADWRSFVEEITVASLAKNWGVAVYKNNRYVFVQTEGRTVTIPLDFDKGTGNTSRVPVKVETERLDDNTIGINIWGISRNPVQFRYFESDNVLKLHHTEAIDMPRIEKPKELPVYFADTPYDLFVERLNAYENDRGDFGFAQQPHWSVGYVYHSGTRGYPIVILDPKAPAILKSSNGMDFEVTDYRRFRNPLKMETDHRFDLTSGPVRRVLPDKTCTVLSDDEHAFVHQAELAKHAVVVQNKGDHQHYYYNLNAKNVVKELIDIERFDAGRLSRAINYRNAVIFLKDNQLLEQTTDGTWRILAYGQYNREGKMVPPWFREHLPKVEEDRSLSEEAIRVQEVRDVFVVDQEILDRFNRSRKGVAGNDALPGSFVFPDIIQSEGFKKGGKYYVVIIDGAEGTYTSMQRENGDVVVQPNIRSLGVEVEDGHEWDGPDVEIIPIERFQKKCDDGVIEYTQPAPPSETETGGVGGGGYSRQGWQSLSRISDLSGTVTRRLDDDVPEDDGPAGEDRGRGANPREQKLGYDHASNQPLTIHPQPATEHILVSGPLHRGTQAYVQTVTGQVLFQHGFHTSADRSISVGSLPAGVYLLRVEQPQGVQVLRFVKR